MTSVVEAMRLLNNRIVEALLKAGADVEDIFDMDAEMLKESFGTNYETYLRCKFVHKSRHCGHARIHCFVVTELA